MANKCQNTKVTGARLNTLMKNKEKLEEEDFDSIVIDKLTKDLLAKLGLMPSAWSIQENERKRILDSKLQIAATVDLAAKNWPACADCKVRKIMIGQDFLENDGFTTTEKAAIMFHEIGHIVNPAPPEASTISKSGDEWMEDYLSAMDPGRSPASPSELYADDYARHCGFHEALISVLKKLREQKESFKTESILQRIERVESSVGPLLQNLSEN